MHVWYHYLKKKNIPRLYTYLYFTVATMISNHCAVGSEVRVSNHSRGMLASILTHDTGCGARYRPWVIEVEISQKINLTLYDFSSLDTFLYTQLPCPIYVIVREDSTGEAVHICGKAQRVSNIYTSLSNRIQIELDLVQSYPAASFAVEYEGG